MMIAEILATGDEIRTGALVDSNSAYVAELLEQNGIEVARHQSIGDDLKALTQIIVEISRANEFGFTEREIDLAKKELIADAERSVNTEDTANARSFMFQIMK